MPAILMTFLRQRKTYQLSLNMKLKKQFVIVFCSIQLCGFSLFSQEAEDSKRLLYKLNLVVNYLENNKELACYLRLSELRKLNERKVENRLKKKSIAEEKNMIFVVPFWFQYNNPDAMSFDCLNNIKPIGFSFTESSIAAFLFNSEESNNILVHIVSYKKKDVKKGESVFVSSYLKRYWHGTQLVYEFRFANDTIVHVEKSVRELW